MALSYYRQSAYGQGPKVSKIVFDGRCDGYYEIYIMN